ncbi:MAG: response regulator [Planctomycetota bacterium]
MLVLSRRESDKILFPSLGISVEVLRIQGNKARLGVEAPDDVPILRHEIADLKNFEFNPEKQKDSDRLRQLVLAIRMRLDSAAVGLNELHRTVDEKSTADAQQLIEDLFSELSGLEREANRILEDSGLSVNDTPQALLVEDSATERTLLEAYLDLTGFQVTTANDGQDALDFLSLHAPPDIILLDMNMPRMDGVTFVRNLRSDPKLCSMPVFALTGMDRDQVDLPSGEKGVERWYQKPVDPKSLVADVAEHLLGRPLMIA